MSGKVREKRKPTFFLALLPILSMVVLIGGGYAIFGLNVEVLILASTAIAAIVAVYLGYTLSLIHI